MVYYRVVGGGVANGTPVDLVTAFDYDKVGNRVYVLDAEHSGQPDKASRYEHDFKGNITKVTDALGHETIFDYGREGCSSCGSGVDQLNAVKDAKNNETTFDYYPTGNLERETYPSSHPIVYTYTTGGLIWQKKDEVTGKVLIEYSYYDNGSLKLKSYPQESKTVDYTYWPVGLVKTVSGSGVTYTYDYYDNGRLKKVTDSRGLAVNYNYETVDGIIKKRIVGVDGAVAGTPRSVVYENDSKGRLWKIWSPADLAGKPLEFGYDTRGHRGSLSYPNGVVATYGYHPKMDWLTSVNYQNAGILVEYPLYDSVGNRKQRVENGLSTTYDYDDVTVN